MQDEKLAFHPKEQNALQVQQIESKSPYPVALAERVLTLESQVKGLQQGTATKLEVDAIQTNFTTWMRQQVTDSRIFYEIANNRDPAYALAAAKTLIDEGYPTEGKAVAIVAISQIVGTKNNSCRSVPVTEPLYLRIPADELAWKTAMGRSTRRSRSRRISTSQAARATAQTPNRRTSTYPV